MRPIGSLPGDAVPFIDVLLPEYDHETSTTRRLLERIPAAAFGWKPHDRSMPLGSLATHVADLPRWIGVVMTRESCDVADESMQSKCPVTSTQQLLRLFDDNVAAARVQLVAARDGVLAEPWTLKRGTHDLFTMPRIMMMRYFVLNHLVHHRGQLSVYVRMHDVPMPAFYGPSADEGSYT